MQGLYVMITQRTGTAFGRPLNPHLFRDAAATSLAVDDPDNVRVATTLLGHGSLNTTAKHYNQARTLTATRAYQKHVQVLRGRAKRVRTRSRKR
jgi:integrase